MQSDRIFASAQHRARVSKRRFLASLAGGVALAAVPTTGAAVMDPMTALAIANTTLSVVKSFTRSGDGLAAMLRAQLVRLDVIIGQLNDIQSSITRLQIRIDELPDEIQGLLREEYRDELINGLVAAADQYAQVLSALQRDPASITHSTTVTELHDILADVSRLRTRLRRSRGGIGPEAATIVPIALALEVGAQGRLQVPSARIRATLDSYDEWARSMSGSEPGSIGSEIATQRDLHDALIDDLAATRIGRLAQIGQYKMALSPPRPVVVREVCSLVCNVPLTGGARDVVVSTRALRDSICPVAWLSEREFGPRLNPDLRAYQLSYTPTYEGPGRSNIGDNCTVDRRHNRDGREASELTASEVRREARPGIRRHAAESTLFQAALTRLDYFRARAAYSVNALELLGDVSRQTSQYRTLLRDS
jgi:hypothetical protein